MQKDAELPDLCVKCGASADGYRLKKTFYWHNPAFYLIIFFPGILIYAIVALCIRQKATVGMGLCPEHRAKRMKAAIIGWLLFFLGLAGLIGGSLWAVNAHGSEGANAPFVILGGIVLLLVSVFWGIFAVRTLAPKKIDKTNAWFGGAASLFLSTLPAQ